MAPDQITKEAFLTGVRCPTEGWRTLRAERESLTPALEWRFHIGAEVGRRAQEQLGRGRGLLRFPVDKAAGETRAALADPTSTLLFEATLLAPPFVARADALRRNGSGWDLIEVKSGKKDEEKGPKEEYLDDLAYTTMVATRAGLSPARLSLMLINPDYRLGASAPLMTEVDVTEEVLARAGKFAADAVVLAPALLATVEPPGALKFACRNCSHFAESCVGLGIPDPLFDLPYLREKKFLALKGFGRVSAIPLDFELSDGQEPVARAIRNGRAETIPHELKRLAAVEWPAFYLDFEGVAPAIPWFPETEPYRAIPFQYSLHRSDAPGHETGHWEYLASADGDWRAILCENLLAQLGDRGSIVVYSGYEKRMLHHLASALPEHADRIQAVVGRLFDLEPVVRKGYIHPGFHGSSSIKQVLPVMVPELQYSGMEVADGLDAEGVFALMRVGKYDSSASSKHRRHLLEYCKLDTLAMVKVHEALLGLVQL